MQTCENGRTTAHRDNEKHISAVQSRMEARETETETRERERKGDPEGGRERWRQKSKTFLPYKVLRLQLHKSVFHKSYASLFPVSPAGLSFKPSWITHSQASNSIRRTRTHTHLERRETLADEALRVACTLPFVSQHATGHQSQAFTLSCTWHMRVNTESKCSPHQNGFFFSS